MPTGIPSLHALPIQPFQGKHVNQFSQRFANLMGDHRRRHVSHEKQSIETARSFFSGASPSSLSNPSFSLNALDETRTLPLNDILALVNQATSLAGQITDTTDPSGAIVSNAAGGLVGQALNVSSPTALITLAGTLIVILFQSQIQSQTDNKTKNSNNDYLLYALIGFTFVIGLVMFALPYIKAAHEKHLLQEKINQEKVETAHKLSLLHGALLSAIHNFVKEGEHSDFLHFLKMMGEEIVEGIEKYAKYIPGAVLKLSTVVSLIIGFLTPQLAPAAGLLTTAIKTAEGFAATFGIGQLVCKLFHPDKEPSLPTIGFMNLLSPPSSSSSSSSLSQEVSPLQVSNVEAFVLEIVNSLKENLKAIEGLNFGKKNKNKITEVHHHHHHHFSTPSELEAQDFETEESEL